VSDGPDATPRLAAEAGRGSHLLIIDGMVSTIVGLPVAGKVAVGRAPDCEIRLHDPACSRRHAQFHIAGGEVTLEDLGSHNGTRVNGQRVYGRRALASDDVIGIGPIKIVLHAADRARRAGLLQSGALEQRLAQEVERALCYERPLSVIVAAVAPALQDAAVRAVLDCVRLVDVVGMLDEHHIAVLAPEVVPDAARQVAHELLASLAEPDAVGIGVAHCPGDASRPDTLVAAARAAATVAGRVRDAAECVVEYKLGRATVLVADAAMIQVYDLLRRLAPSELSVLVLGETGVGKDSVAHAVHAWSRRAGGPFVAINCASLPDALVESELFGYDRGAVSEAGTGTPGRLEAADHGTVFLDEIGELPLAAQAKLLRVLESSQLPRLGAALGQPIDIRVVASTNRDLEAEIAAGRFREDLYFRLGGAKVMLPPLRDRPRELALLARFFLSRACAASGRAVPELSAAALGALDRYRWPGNIRELKNEMEFVAATAVEPVIEPWHLSAQIVRATPVSAARGAAVRPADDAPKPVSASPFRPIGDELRELERRRMIEALAAAGGVQKRAAELIGMPLRTFTMKYKQYGLGER
jgi:two-component system, NtrC family, response regulator AtoC